MTFRLRLTLLVLVPALALAGVSAVLLTGEYATWNRVSGRSAAERNPVFSASNKLIEGAIAVQGEEWSFVVQGGWEKLDRWRAILGTQEYAGGYQADFTAFFADATEVINQVQSALGKEQNGITRSLEVRAGQCGKGFAVVAEEVRNLSLKSAKAVTRNQGVVEESFAASREATSAEQIAGQSTTVLGLIRQFRLPKGGERIERRHS